MDERFFDPEVQRAHAVATTAHAPHREKSTGAPYIEHPERVALAVLEAGGSVEQAQAALLHDVIEEAGPEWWPQIEAFGPVVTEIVRVCTDDEPTDGKRPWIDRKTEHVAKLRAGVLAEAYAVIAADKLDALRRTTAELAATGDAYWARGIFKGGRCGTVWYYRSMGEILDPRVADEATRSELADHLHALATATGLTDLTCDELLERARTRPFPEGIRSGEGGPAAP